MEFYLESHGESQTRSKERAWFGVGQISPFFFLVEFGMEAAVLEGGLGAKEPGVLGGGDFLSGLAQHRCEIDR